MLQRLCVSFRPNLFRSVIPPRKCFGPSAYRAGTPSLSRARLRCVWCRKLKSYGPGRGSCAPARGHLQRKAFGRREVCNLTLSAGLIDLRIVQMGNRGFSWASDASETHSAHIHRGRSLGRWHTAQAAREQNDTKQVRICMYVRTYACMYVCMYVCIYVCMYVCTHV